MHRLIRSIAALGVISLAAGSLEAQQMNAATYARAERLLGVNARELVIDDAVQPRWMTGERFWFRNRNAVGYEFVVVDAATGSRRPLFDHVRLAAALSVVADTSYDAAKLPFRDVTLLDSGRTIRFATGKSRYWACSILTYKCVGPDTVPSERATEIKSPDGKWAAFTRDDNLWLRSVATGERVQLTSDAEPDYGYAKPTGCCQQVSNVRLKREVPPVVRWSSDSRHIATYKMDERKVRQMYLLEAKNPGPVLHSYRYALPGDSIIPTYDMYVFDVATRHGVKMQRPPQPVVNTTCCTLITDTILKDARFDAPGDHLFFTYGARGYHHLELLEGDVATGAVRTVVTEKSSTYIETNLAAGGIPNWRPVAHDKDIIWFSERDGWAHLYRIDGTTGEVKNRITSGNWTVGDLLRVDEATGWIYFTGRGREPHRDPYFRHLYRVKLDGTGLQLLTPENADHAVSLSPSGAYFVDGYSAMDTIPITIVRRLDGTFVREVQRGDVRQLAAIGWRHPIPFTVKARDGMTDLYGLLFRPSTFDSTKSYPIIDHIYPGPQTGPIGNRDFGAALRGTGSALAELGFFVIELDAMGTPFRSKAFHDAYYGNMGDNGIADHVAAIKQLAALYPQIDQSRVGIFGHSGGGFSSTDAILRYPDFFKVAVSSAGNHDQRSYDYTWGEKYQGLLTQRPDSTDNYDSQSNWRIADRLKGKLMLMYGTLDDNVHPVATQLLIDALIKANKDFELVVLPNRNHSFASEPYAIRRSWDFFVRHLLGSEPPPAYPLVVVTQPDGTP
ncbi:MAG: S9 family peptidase [Gemmatimonadota bacterium]|nr:S9 family peptidase [Gemmatimonadota bacterium]